VKAHRSVFYCISTGVLITLLSCRSNQGGKTFSVHINVEQYGLARVRETGREEQTFSFPIIELFDAHRRRLRFDKAIYNRPDAILSAAPQLLRDSKPDMSADSDLPQFLEHLTGLSDSDLAYLLRSGRPMLVLASIEGCEACTIQDKAVAHWQQRVLDGDIDMLDINVATP
jgi:hypothetical protein